jgi:S1-C subfamily serine protease
VSEANPKLLPAGQREAGSLCAHCSRELQRDEPTALCTKCGAVHHQACWESAGGCGSYECARSGTFAMPRGLEKISISHADLAAATPLPPPVQHKVYEPAPEPPPRWNRVAVWAFAVAVAGIPLFGLVTGIVAIVVACIALVGHTSNRKGMPLAVAAILIGLVDVVGWAFALSSYYGGAGSGIVALSEFSIDPESLSELPERISRAMRANVLIQANFGIGRQGLGSGVILKIHDGSAYIVTNRHVVDEHFSEDYGAADANVDLSGMADLNVLTVEQSLGPAKVEWVAPHGVDLAIIVMPLLGAVDQLQEAAWNGNETPRIGDAVFAVGNPHGLGWTHSSGSISQVRRREQGAFSFRVLQSTAPINPGNSGGGLYDADGRLIGINTMTGDKRFAEGLGFAIALPTLLELVPDKFGIEEVNAPPMSPDAIETALDVDMKDDNAASIDDEPVQDRATAEEEKSE